jgi:hypothetical protein
LGSEEMKERNAEAVWRNWPSWLANLGTSGSFCEDSALIEFLECKRVVLYQPR